MNERQPYRYWLLRYVPDTIRGEFVNIGILVGGFNPEDWAIKTVSSFSRAGKLGGNPEIAKEWLRRLQIVVESPKLDRIDLELFSMGRSEFPSPEWVDVLRERHNNAVQISEASPVRARSADHAAEMLFNTLVLDPKGKGRESGRSRAMKTLRVAYESSPLISRNKILLHPKMITGRQAAQFEFAIANSSIAQISQVWSFDRKDPEALSQQIQAWSFAVDRMRRDGGTIREIRRKADKSPSLRVVRDVPIRVLFVPPRNNEQEEVLALAEDAWRELGVQAYPAGEEQRLVKDAEMRLQAI